MEVIPGREMFVKGSHDLASSCVRLPCFKLSMRPHNMPENGCISKIQTRISRGSSWSQYSHSVVFIICNVAGYSLVPKTRSDGTSPSHSKRNIRIAYYAIRMLRLLCIIMRPTRLVAAWDALFLLHCCFFHFFCLLDLTVILHMQRKVRYITKYMLFNTVENLNGSGQW